MLPLIGFAIALAVGLTPEFLPIILSVTQAQGALQMAHRKVIVRQLCTSILSSSVHTSINRPIK